MKKKKTVTGLSAALLALLYLAIFGFSGQTGEESGSLSFYISEKCAEIVNALAGQHWTEQMLNSVALYFEHPIRKLAHFTEYACMGILVYTMWVPWKKPGRRLYMLTVIWVFLSAAADELHQFFVPGRYCSFADVLLDTLGGCFGILVCVLSAKVFTKRRKAQKGL